MTKETWEQQKKDSKQPQVHEFIKCGKCGRGISAAIFDNKTHQILRVVGKVTLNAVREAPVFNQVSGKSHKGKVVGYLCDQCCR
jgi:hypothetical protein